jgi:hypothetical protein
MAAVAIVVRQAQTRHASRIHHPLPEVAPFHMKMACSQVHQSRLDLASSFVDPTDSKLYCSSGVKTPLADGKLTTFHLQLSLAETISESLWSLRISMVGSHDRKRRRTILLSYPSSRNSLFPLASSLWLTSSGSVPISMKSDRFVNSSEQSGRSSTIAGPTVRTSPKFDNPHVLRLP